MKKVATIQKQRSDHKGQWRAIGLPLASREKTENEEKRDLGHLIGYSCQNHVFCRLEAKFSVWIKMLLTRTFRQKNNLNSFSTTFIIFTVTRGIQVLHLQIKGEFLCEKRKLESSGGLGSVFRLLIGKQSHFAVYQFFAVNKQSKECRFLYSLVFLSSGPAGVSSMSRVHKSSEAAGSRNNSKESAQKPTTPRKKAKKSRSQGNERDLPQDPG